MTAGDTINEQVGRGANESDSATQNREIRKRDQQPRSFHIRMARQRKHDGQKHHHHRRVIDQRRKRQRQNRQCQKSAQFVLACQPHEDARQCINRACSFQCRAQHEHRGDNNRGAVAEDTERFIRAENASREQHCHRA